MQFSQKIAPCLWFDSQGEEAANFYVGIFKNSRITSISRYGKAGQETHKRPEGSVLTVAFELDGGALQLDTAVLEDIAAVGQSEGERHLLLGDEQGDSLLA